MWREWWVSVLYIPSMLTQLEFESSESRHIFRILVWKRSLRFILKQGTHSNRHPSVRPFRTTETKGIGKKDRISPPTDCIVGGDDDYKIQDEFGMLWHVLEMGDGRWGNGWKGSNGRGSLRAPSYLITDVCRRGGRSPVINWHSNRSIDNVRRKGANIN